VLKHHHTTINDDFSCCGLYGTCFLLKFEGSLHRRANAIFQAMRHSPADCNKLAESLLSHKKLMW